MKVYVLHLVKNIRVSWNLMEVDYQFHAFSRFYPGKDLPTQEAYQTNLHVIVPLSRVIPTCEVYQ
jgi:hypothetical protein